MKTSTVIITALRCYDAPARVKDICLLYAIEPKIEVTPGWVMDTTKVVLSGPSAIVNAVLEHFKVKGIQHEHERLSEGSQAGR